MISAHANWFLRRRAPWGWRARRAPTRRSTKHRKPKGEPYSLPHVCFTRQSCYCREEGSAPIPVRRRVVPSASTPLRLVLTLFCPLSSSTSPFCSQHESMRCDYQKVISLRWASGWENGQRLLALVLSSSRSFLPLWRLVRGHQNRLLAHLCNTHIRNPTGSARYIAHFFGRLRELVTLALREHKAPKKALHKMQS